MRLRDSFDSAFDEVHRIPPLSVMESITLVRAKWLDMPYIYGALCHAIGGGLPRDIMRTASELLDQLNSQPDAARSVEQSCSLYAVKALRLTLPAVVEQIERQAVRGSGYDRVFDSLKIFEERIDSSAIAEAISALGRLLRPTSVEAGGRTDLLVAINEAITNLAFFDTLITLCVRISEPECEHLGAEVLELFSFLALARGEQAVHPALSLQTINDVRQSISVRPISGVAD